MDTLKTQEIPLVDFQHHIYKPASFHEADGVAWIFKNSQDLVIAPFILPPIVADEIKINILYSGLCQGDVHFARGQLGPMPYPLCMGHEIIGSVAEVGKDVKDFKVGDIVGYGFGRNYCEKCDFCQKGQSNYCQGIGFDQLATALVYWGGYSTVLQQPAKCAYHIPKGIQIETAAPLMCAGLTVFSPLVTYAKPGDHVGILGIGGLGHLAIQFATKMGYHVTAFTSKSGIEEELKKFGAEKVVSSYEGSELAKQKSTLDLILNTVPELNGSTMSQLLDTLKVHGTMVMLGGGPNITISPMGPLLMKGLKMIGSAGGSSKDMQNMLEFAAKYDIKPVCEFFEFEDLAKGFQKLEKGKPHFRCVIKVDDFSKKYNYFNKH